MSRRKSRFVSEFRNQLVRIPLQHRTKDAQSKTFVLKKDSGINPRLLGTFSTPQRKQRKVSDWAKTKNLSFNKAREDLLIKRSSSPAVVPLNPESQQKERRFSKSFINFTMEQPVPHPQGTPKGG